MLSIIYTRYYVATARIVGELLWMTFTVLVRCMPRGLAPSSFRSMVVFGLLDSRICWMPVFRMVSEFPERFSEFPEWFSEFPVRFSGLLGIQTDFCGERGEVGVMAPSEKKREKKLVVVTCVFPTENFKSCVPVEVERAVRCGEEKRRGSCYHI